MPPDNRSIFVSHVHEDAAVALWLQQQLRIGFVGGIGVFVSSERTAQAGRQWLRSIEEELQRCDVLVALCSRYSVHRPWVNFELGGAWVLRKRIIPACHAGLTPQELGMPLVTLDAITLTEADGMRVLFATIAQHFGFDVPDKDFAALAAAVPAVQTTSARDPAAAQREPQTAQRDRDIVRRLHAALEGRFALRTIGWVATEAGVSEEMALDYLRGDDEVRFTRSPKGERLVGLKSRRS
ncbi:MAG: hypothetical protein QOE31_3831 [Solirubrobacteraceae bacterium]|jgi:hypothetical protein|nr:hypothetical protein [Solirubrobacteraceae bacterium]